MPSKAAAELRELTDDQLIDRAESAKEELFNLRFQLATGQLDNSSAIKKIRHEIARIATVIRQRDIEVRKAGAELPAEPRTGPRTEPRTEKEQ
jgi:large subunit ribosomal protein L29